MEDLQLLEELRAKAVTDGKLFFLFADGSFPCPRQYSVQQETSLESLQITTLVHAQHSTILRVSQKDTKESFEAT